MYRLSLISPVVFPEVLVSARVAGRRLHVVAPPQVIANFTGTTPRPALKTLDPSGLIGCCTVAISLGSRMAKGDSDATLAQTTLVVVSSETVRSTQTLFSR